MNKIHYYIDNKDNYRIKHFEFPEEVSLLDFPYTHSTDKNDIKITQDNILKKKIGWVIGDKCWMVGQSKWVVENLQLVYGPYEIDDVLVDDKKLIIYGNSDLFTVAIDDVYRTEKIARAHFDAWEVDVSDYSIKKSQYHVGMVEALLENGFEERGKNNICRIKYFSSEDEAKEWVEKNMPKCNNNKIPSHVWVWHDGGPKEFEVKNVYFSRDRRDRVDGNRGYVVKYYNSNDELYFDKNFCSQTREDCIKAELIKEQTMQNNLK